MKAIVSRYKREEWVRVTVMTNPLQTSIEGEDQENKWLDSLPPALVNGKSTEIREDPEGWMTSITGMPYTLFTVEVVEV